MPPVIVTTFSSSGLQSQNYKPVPVFPVGRDGRDGRLGGNEIRLSSLRLQLPRIFIEDPHCHCADERTKERALLHTYCNCTATAVTALQLPSSVIVFFSTPHHAHHTHSATRCPCPPFFHAVWSCHHSFQTTPKQPAHPRPPTPHAITAFIPSTRVVADLPSLLFRPGNPFATTTNDDILQFHLLFLASDSRRQVPPLFPRLRPMRSRAR